uniref:Uncharacterized protein n=1 Tax=Ovis aries TaxID=9940 RepID=A0AC11E5P9_SHEEP
MASERLPSRPACLLVASGAAEGVSAQSFLHCFTLASAAFSLQVATPGGKPMDFVDVNESNARWVQDFRLKAYASPAKLESIDGARYHALLIPSCPGALVDLASSGSLARILQHFHSESSRCLGPGVGGWREIQGRWDPADREECLRGCGRWCRGPHWGSGFGGNAESLQELPRVSVGRRGPDQWTGLLSAYTRVYTHTKVGIPSTAGLPTCPCGASAWFPWGLWAGSPTPCKMGRQDAGLVPGGVCGWPGGRGWENCPEETCLLQGDVAHCPGLASGRVGKPKAVHSVLCWWKRGLPVHGQCLSGHSAVGTHLCQPAL